jgi:hypothetical protein
MVACRLNFNMHCSQKVVIIVCKRMQSRGLISTTLRHNFESGITTGYIVSHPWHTIHDALLGVPEQFRYQNHPLLIPLLMVERMLKEMAEDYEDNDANVHQIEKSTGFNNYTGREDDYQSVDYRQLAKRLGKTASHYAFTKTSLMAVKLSHEFCLQQLKSCQSWIPEDKWKDYRETTARLVERAEYNASHIEHMLVYRGLEMRLQAQQNVVSERCCPAVLSIFTVQYRYSIS